MIPRPLDEKAVRARLNQFKVTAILGPRQSGKITLAGLVDSGACFDFENPRDLARLENPQLTLEKCSGTIIIDEIQRKPDENAYFWSTHTGAEVDLFWQHDGRNWACEFKYADAPVMTKSMHAALNDLDLKKLWVIYPGDKRYDIHEKVEALPLSQAPAEWKYP